MNSDPVNSTSFEELQLHLRAFDAPDISRDVLSQALHNCPNISPPAFNRLWWIIDVPMGDNNGSFANVGSAKYPLDLVVSSALPEIQGVKKNLVK